MLILCCGPDTYRASLRARELEAAFREKHDPSGSSVDRVSSGKGAADEVIERSLTVSLFSPMRFIRADALIKDCPKQKVKALVQALSRDSKRVIVVSIEQEKPTVAAMKPFSDIPSLLMNDYPLLEGKAFLDWIQQTGALLGLSNATVLRKLADACNGDAWLASNELIKLAAGGTSEVVREHEAGTYEVVDAFLEKASTRYRLLAKNDSYERTSYLLFQQAQSALRVQSGDVQGLSAFVTSKLKRLRETDVISVASKSLLFSILSRSGLANAEELSAILP